MTEDPRDAAAHYRMRRELGGVEPAEQDDDRRGEAARPRTEWERQAYVETVIQQAIRRGAFDDLPGAGKPLEGLGDHDDPDWWIRRKIQTEKLTGLGPPALTLRVEHERMQQSLDALARAEEVRELLEDFNRRVIEARRQLLGGPPVVTPTRDVDAEVAAWRERRADRERAEAARTTAEQARLEASGRHRRWFRPHR